MNFKTLEERNAWLRKVNQAHKEWSLAHENDDVFTVQDINPHDTTTKETDYPFFYLDRSGDKDIEDDFIQRIS